MAVALAGYLLIFGLPGVLPSSRYITGAYLIAIRMPFKIFCVFNDLRVLLREDFLHSGRINGVFIPKIIDAVLSLAMRAVVRPPSGHHNPADRRLAAAARQASALVDAVFELKEPPHSVGVNVI